VKALKLASDAALLLALLFLVVAVVGSAAWAYAVAGLCLVTSVVLTVRRRRAQAARRTARA
jgi:hypothetical protein